MFVVVDLVPPVLEIWVVKANWFGLVIDPVSETRSFMVVALSMRCGHTPAIDRLNL